MMRIAATYDSGKIFQHFGRTEYFKVYDVEDGKITATRLIGAEGAGHGALAQVLAEHGIDTLICGGLGDGALDALTRAGITVAAGAEGSADEAVEAYLRGSFVSSGANCDHHGHGEDHDCGRQKEDAGADKGEDQDAGCCGGYQDEGCGAGCCGGYGEEAGCSTCGSSGCGGCSGCGTPQIILEGKNAGRTCRVHYTGTFNDGTKFDSSYDRGEPLEFICGVGMMIRGFDQAVADMEPGQVIDIHLMPEEAYGVSHPENIVTFEIAQLAGSEELNIGDRVLLQDAYGRPVPVTVTAKDDTNITFDANHERAGKELNFRIELVEVMG